MQLKKPAVFLDRDGVINVDRGYVASRADFEWIPGAIQAIKALNDSGYYVFVATNQSGIARGFFDTATLIAIHNTMNRAVAQAGGRIDAVFFCPHAQDSNCGCRKPQPGMLIEIGRRFNVLLQDVYMVGDQPRDLGAAAAAGARPVLVLTGKGQRTLAEGKLPPGTQVFDNLAAFAEQLAP